MATLPNALTIVRILLIPVIAVTILLGRFELALPILFLAGISDAIDGYFARRWKQQSRLGAMLDPAADKLLLLTVYLALAFARALPAWTVALVIGRDVVIVVGVLVLVALKRSRNFPPTIWGKVSTFYQLMLGGAVVMHGAFPAWMPEAALVFLLAGTCAATIVSGVDYIRIGVRMAAR